MNRRTKSGVPMYSHGHQQQRKRWAPKVRAGKVNCWRCDRLIPPTATWDLGHMDNGGTAREHVGCNRATVTHLKQALEGEKSQPDPTPSNGVARWSRHWSGST